MRAYAKAGLVVVILSHWRRSCCDSSENLGGWVQAHDQILEYDFKAIVCGDVSRYGTREDVLIEREYTHDLVRFSRERRSKPFRSNIS